MTAMRLFPSMRSLGVELPDTKFGFLGRDGSQDRSIVLIFLLSGEEAEHIFICLFGC